MLNATPWVNIPSEMLGALACGLLIHVPMRIAGKVDLNPLVTTFLSTAVSATPLRSSSGVALNGLSLPVTLGDLCGHGVRNGNRELHPRRDPHPPLKKVLKLR